MRANFSTVSLSDTFCVAMNFKSVVQFVIYLSVYFKKEMKRRTYITNRGIVSDYLVLQFGRVFICDDHVHGFQYRLDMGLTLFIISE